RDPAAFAAHVGRILDDPMLAGEMAIESALRARQYTWSIAAARLRRLYSDLTSRSLVECR
ncbi:MAG TPA: hypothetical protein VFA83_18060, partial [Acidimicrobiales bacterium]|nr:hypothetical protein [Acidimicrobiales bacterium]